MAQQRRAPVPRRIVGYRTGGDALGNFITFTVDMVVLPRDVPPHTLPEGTTLTWERLHFRFSGASNLGAHELRQLFLEFAQAMNWEARLDV